MPIVDPSLLLMRAFSAATLGSLLSFIGFAAMLLASVLFLTGVWHEPILTAGLMMISPGPAMARSPQSRARASGDTSEPAA